MEMIVGWWLAIPARYKLYTMIFVAFLIGLFRLRSAIVDRALEQMEAKVNEEKLRSIENAREIENEVQALDRDTLRKRATRWVRGPER